MKRIAIARVFQETSSFSATKTTLDDFRQFGLHFGESVFTASEGLADEIDGFRAVAREDANLELVPVMWAVGWTGGTVTQDAFEYLKRELIKGITAIPKLDGVLLALHGSMAAEHTDDTEGEILAEVRAAIGRDLPLVATFDHHANMTRRRISNVDALAAYLHCPHRDTMDTGVRGARLMQGLLSGKTAPTIAFCKIPMITPADRYETDKLPLKAWFDAGRAIERDPKVLAVAQFPVQPWLDVEEHGWSVAVVTDRAPELAEKYAVKLAQQAWDMRREFLVDNPGPEEAIRMAMREEGPIVLADGADATNGGAPGDSTILLAEMLRQRIDKTAFLTMVDPAAAGKALEAGIGNEVTVDLGGKRDHYSKPVRVTGRVTHASDGRFRIRGGSHHAINVDMGRTVVLQAGSIHIVVSEKLNPGHDPLVYRHIGLEPKDAQIVMVKCVVGHMLAYAPIMKKTIWTDCPGATPSNLLRLDHRRSPRPLFPLDADMEWQATVAGRGGLVAAGS